MSAREIFDVMGQGTLLAVAIRWLFNLDIELHWAAAIGSVSLLLQPWLTLHYGPLMQVHTLPEMAMSAVVALALLGAAQVLASR